MTILQSDVRFVASQVMDDVPEGGGAPSGTLIVDGASNGVFSDVSELDRAGGRVKARKLFLHVRTPTLDGFYGANIIIAEPYADPRVSATLFATDDPFDRRAAAMSRVESYLSRGPAYPGHLFGDHLAGQGVLLVLQRPELPIPGVGDTLVLQQGAVEEYVRLSSITTSLRTFTDSNGDFTRTMLTLELTNVLANNFNGFDAMRQDASINYTGRTKLFESVVADAARYYGTSPLVTAASLGDLSLRVGTIFSQLVPSTRLEVPIADSRVNQQSATVLAAGASGSVTYTLAWTTSQALFLGAPVAPGSFSVARDGITLTDKGGVLYNASTAVGTIDYGSGIARLQTNVFGTNSGAHSATFVPASTPVIVTDSLGIAVTEAGQRLTWVYTLDPVPARGTLQISYRALGKWYVLTDDGSGALRGADSSYGAGTINFTTGTVSLTLGALPDVDSRIISTWASSVVGRSLSGVPVSSAFSRTLRKTLVLPPLKPGTVTVAWNDGVARTATDVDGALSGDAIGAVRYGAGTIDFSPNLLPAPGTAITVTVSTTTERKGVVASLTDAGSAWTFSLGGAVKARGVELSLVAQWPQREFPGVDVTRKTSLLVTDDGSGNLIVTNTASPLVVGAVNYSTGACSVSKTVAGLQVEQPTFAKRTPTSGDTSSYVKQTGFELRTVTLTFLNGSGADLLGLPAWAWWSGAQTSGAQYRAAGVDAAAGQVYNFTLDSLSFPISDLVKASIVGPTVVYSNDLSGFNVGSTRYVVRDSVVQRNPSPTTGEGVDSGSASGFSVSLLWWPTGVSPNPSAFAGTQAATVVGGGQVLDTVTARTAVSPLVPTSFSIAGAWDDGTPFSATADSNGRISSGTAHSGSEPGSYGVFGIVDYETGVIDLRFGRRIAASGPAVIDAGALGLPGVTYIESRGVQADSLRYNAVGYSYLPLDPEILGLNTVRLPADGRVPIFREGTFIVVGNTATTTAATVSNGQTINCARVRLSRVRVIGSDDLTISSGYTVDLDAGTVTFTDVTGYAQPVRVEHRIEDMVLLNDVQISGQLSFTRPLTHDYPTTGTYVSSALVIGDVKARVSLTFDQQTWGNQWQDTVSGSSAAATYNTIQYPIEVTNAGALTERWAVVFQSNNTSFNLVGENLGVVGTGTVNADFSPINPDTGEPYLTIRSAGWGGAWVSGNVLRANTIGAIPAFWVMQTILQGPETVISDKFTLLGRGDVDRP